MGGFKFQESNWTDVRKITKERIENYDMIRRHDTALAEYLKLWVPFPDPDNPEEWLEGEVPLIFATPKREYSGDDDRKTAMTWDGDYEPTQLERIIYPSMALTRLDATFDQSRWTYPKWHHLSYSDDLNLVQIGNFPLPYNFMYQVDFWADTYQDLNHFLENYARKFRRPTWWLDVYFPMPWGWQTLHMMDQGSFSMNSELEGGEQQRELRGVATIKVEGWIPLPTEWARTILKYSVDLIEESSQEILATYETEVADKQEFWETGEKEQVLEWI